MAVLEARVEIAWRDRGEGRPVLLIHETAVTATIWNPLAEAISDGAGDRLRPARLGILDGSRRISANHDRGAERGCRLVARIGRDGAVGALWRRGRRRDRPGPPSAPSGAGHRRRADRASLLGLLPAATEILSDDRVRLHEALASGGAQEAIRLYLSGTLEALGPGIGRLDDAATSDARERPAVLFAGSARPRHGRPCPGSPTPRGHR